MDFDFCDLQKKNEDIEKKNIDDRVKNHKYSGYMNDLIERYKEVLKRDIIMDPRIRCVKNDRIRNFKEILLSGFDLLAKEVFSDSDKEDLTLFKFVASICVDYNLFSEEEKECQVISDAVFIDDRRDIEYMDYVKKEPSAYGFVINSIESFIEQYSNIFSGHAVSSFLHNIYYSPIIANSSSLFKW